jgi:hypothetical protein
MPRTPPRLPSTLPRIRAAAPKKRVRPTPAKLPACEPTFSGKLLIAAVRRIKLSKVSYDTTTASDEQLIELLRVIRPDLQYVACWVCDKYHGQYVSRNQTGDAFMGKDEVYLALTDNTHLKQLLQTIHGLKKVTVASVLEALTMFCPWGNLSGTYRREMCLFGTMTGPLPAPSKLGEHDYGEMGKVEERLHAAPKTQDGELQLAIADARRRIGKLYQIMLKL